MSTGLGLDWFRTIVNFVEFGLDPDCKSLENLGTRPDLDRVKGKGMRKKGMRHFCGEKSCVFQIVWTSIGLGL